MHTLGHDGNGKKWRPGVLKKHLTRMDKWTDLRSFHSEK